MRSTASSGTACCRRGFSTGRGRASVRRGVDPQGAPGPARAETRGGIGLWRVFRAARPARRKLEPPVAARAADRRTAGRRPGPRDLRRRDPVARDPAAGARPLHRHRLHAAFRKRHARRLGGGLRRGRDHLSRPARRYRRAPAAIRGAEVVLAEAMHGAIIADALRTPWVPLLPIHPSHRMKWTDWAASLDLTLTRTDMPPSNLREAYVRATGLDGQGRTSARLAEAAAARPLNALLRHHAARRLRRLAATGVRHLSEEARIGEATERCLERLDRSCGRGRVAAVTPPEGVLRAGLCRAAPRGTGPASATAEAGHATGDAGTRPPARGPTSGARG
jgi:hypothetical protein